MNGSLGKLFRRQADANKRWVEACERTCHALAIILNFIMLAQIVLTLVQDQVLIGRMLVGSLKLLFAGACALSVLPQVVSAQSLADWEKAGRSETRAMASITIPLGGGRQAEKTAPRLDFAIQSYRSTSVAPTIVSVDSFETNPRVQRQSVVSFTLDRRPKLMLNGQRVATFGPTLYADEEEKSEKGGDNTALLVIGGLGALVLGAAVATTADNIDALNDLTDPD
ncbi:MAG: hypothetical protein ABJP34_07450 [Erythrobacter sp.]